MQAQSTAFNYFLFSKGRFQSDIFTFDILYLFLTCFGIISTKLFVDHFRSIRRISYGSFFNFYLYSKKLCQSTVFCARESIQSICVFSSTVLPSNFNMLCFVQSGHFNKRLGLVNTKVPLSTDVLPCSLADYLIFNQFCLEIDSISEINDENGKKKVTSKIIEIFMNRYFFKPGVHQYLFSCGSDRAMICFYWEPKISDGFWCITQYSKIIQHM